MKYVFVIASLCIVSSLTAMEKKKVAFADEDVPFVDPCQLRFKKLFFPDVQTLTVGDVAKVCKMYIGLPDGLMVFDQSIFLKDVKKYAQENNTFQSHIFMRYANELMKRIYNPNFLYTGIPIPLCKKVISDIECDSGLMSYIIMGNRTRYPEQLFTDQKENFKAEVKKYVASQIEMLKR